MIKVRNFWWVRFNFDSSSNEAQVEYVHDCMIQTLQGFLAERSMGLRRDREEDRQSYFASGQPQKCKDSATNHK